MIQTLTYIHDCHAYARCEKWAKQFTTLLFIMLDVFHIYIKIYLCNTFGDFIFSDSFHDMKTQGGLEPCRGI